MVAGNLDGVFALAEKSGGVRPNIKSAVVVHGPLGFEVKVKFIVLDGDLIGHTREQHLGDGILTSCRAAKCLGQSTVDFNVGDTVQITAGPLEGFMGLVEGIDTESFKVKLKVNMFGRETPAEVDIAQVELP